MGKAEENTIHIVNRKAKFSYEFIETYTAGMVLQGTEIKAIREGKANLGDAYCYFRKGELYVKNLHISEYSSGNIHNHEVQRIRKLLLNKRELRQLEKKVKTSGVTIIPYKIFINDRGYAKLEIALAKGKKSHDKRQSIKERDDKRSMDRMLRGRR